MNATLVRTSDNGKETQGQLTVINDNGYNIFSCDTMELSWKDNQHDISCIPPGIYQCDWDEMQNHKGHFHYLLQDVRKRGGIFIHYAQDIEQIEGCIILCSGFNSDGSTINSQETVEAFEGLFLSEGVQQRFNLTIINNIGINVTV